MDVAERSSSNDLSSVPNSDNEGTNTITVSRDKPINMLTSGIPALKGNAGIGVNLTGDRQDTTPKQRKPRKKKDSDATSTPTEKKEKGTRRPRGASTAAGSTRKKLKTETDAPTVTLQAAPPSLEPAYPRPIQQSNVASSERPNINSNEAAKLSQNGFLNNNSAMLNQKPAVSQYNPIPPPPAPIVRSMAYDPVRSLTTPRHPEPPPPPPPIHSPHTNLNTPPRPVYNPSTSPAISSIINPPETISSNLKPIPHSYPPPTDNKPLSNNFVSKPGNESTPMEIDLTEDKPDAVKRSTPEAPVPSKPVAKPRAKEQPPPLPTGSGLLSSSLFGGDSGMDANKSSNDKGTSIVLHVDLKNPSNKVINFARMAEEKYGFAALYPRQAAQKERLAKVAAAGAALERAGSGNKGTPAGESADEEGSVDIDRDSENDGDVLMSGMNGTGEAVNSGTDGPVPKRRKRKDEYDADDPFVDDSELLWEAQAAASKDGFFVYCGPLVPEGEKPTVERADGTVKRGRGRGRGGGPGSRGGRGAAAAARDTDGGAGRGGGPGSRGGGVTRKPRITKAERAQRELEKKQREQMAVLAAKPPNYQP